MRFYILSTISGVIICKDIYFPERQLSQAIEGSRMRIGPMHASRLADYLTEAYPDLWPIAEVQLAQLQASAAPYSFLTFRSQKHRHPCG